jgi:hypothetical protein
MPTDKQTGLKRLIVAFRKFAISAQNFQNTSFAKRTVCLSDASPAVLLAIGIKVSEGFLNMSNL